MKAKSLSSKKYKEIRLKKQSAKNQLQNQVQKRRVKIRKNQDPKENIKHPKKAPARS